MIVTVSQDSPKPVYLQIRDQIVEGIAFGRLRGGEALPPIRRLAADLEVNLHTVNQAYNLLRAEGLVRQARGRGTVVTGPGEVQADDAFLTGWRGRLRTVLAEARARGLAEDAVLRHCRELLADEKEEQA